MPEHLNLRERLIRWIALGVFLVGAAGGVVASVLHWLEADPHPLNLILPEFMTVVSVGLFAYVLRRPESIYAALWIGFLCALSMLVILTWVFVLQAFGTGEVILIERFPPVTPTLLPLLMITILFMSPRWVVVAIVTGWVLVALPLLGYLVTHPHELWTSRGMEMAVMLGPVMVVSVILLPFFKGMDSHVASLRHEKPSTQVLAERDPLTNLYSRSAGEKYLERLVEAADPNSGLILFDVDFFKGINDSHGEEMGDEVLFTISERCSARLRRDDIFARWGGEQFLVLIHGAPRKVVSLVAEDLKNAIADEPFDTVGPVTASFGVTQLRLMDSVESVLERAEDALSVAKRGGRNQVVEK